MCVCVCFSVFSYSLDFSMLSVTWPKDMTVNYACCDFRERGYYIRWCFSLSHTLFECTWCYEGYLVHPADRPTLHVQQTDRQTH